MKTYEVEIKEVRNGKFHIDAESEKEALTKMEAEYWKNPNDFLMEPNDTWFRVVREVD